MNIIRNCYADNASVVWVLRNDRLFRWRLSILARYCFEKGLANNGLFLTDNRKAISILYPLKHERSGFRSIFWEILLAVFGIGVFRIRKVMRRDNFIRRHRSTPDCLYFWMYAVEPGHRSGEDARTMQQFAYGLSDSSNLPILAETSVPKNKKVYERVGFTTYNEWIDPKTEMITWMMERKPGNKKDQK